jgi:hypothetical protein
VTRFVISYLGSIILWGRSVMCVNEILAIRLQTKINLSYLEAWKYFCFDCHDAEVAFVGETWSDWLVPA